MGTAAVAAVSLGNFMVAFDASGVNVAIPSIGSALHAESVWRQWILDGYTVPLCAFLLVAGQIGDRVGGTRLFKMSTAVFALASVLCAVAPNAETLVAARIMQGVAAGFMLPLTLSIISRRIPDASQRSKAIGLWGVVGGIAIASAPLLAGAITAEFGWRALFMINVPLCVAAVLFVPGADDAEPGAQPVDYLGQFFFCACVGALAGTLIELGRGEVSVGLGCGGVFVISAIALVAHNRRSPKALVPRNTLNRPFALTVLGGGCYQFAAYGSLVVLPVFLQLVCGYSVLEAGILLLPCCGGWLVGNLIAMVSPHRHHQVLLRMFPLVGGVSAVCIAVLSTQHLGWMLTASAGIGIAAGILASTLSSTAMHLATTGTSGTSSAVLNVGRQLGMVIAIAILASDAFSHSLTHSFTVIAAVFASMWVACTGALKVQSSRLRQC